MCRGSRWVQRWLPLLVMGGLVWLPCLVGLSAVSAESPLAWEQVTGPWGGRVQALAIQPADPKLIYAGTLNGVYQSSDAGATWVHLQGGALACQDISVLLISPGDARTVYAGGSEGLLRSSDAGVSWEQVGDGLGDSTILALAAHAAQPATLYAGVGDVLLRSRDRGEHWQRLGRGLPPEGRIRAIAIDPATPDSIYVGTLEGVYATVDAGENWRPASAGLPRGNPVYTLSSDARAPGRLYAGAEHGAFVSQDGGGHWSPLGPPEERGPVTAMALDALTGQTLYANGGGHALRRSPDAGSHWLALGAIEYGQAVLALAVHPRDPQRVYAGTERGVYQSADGGASWKASCQGMVDGDVRAMLDIPGTRGQFYVGTSWGVFETRDGGHAWQAHNAGLMSLDIVTLALDRSDAKRLYAVTQAGDIYTSKDGGGTWDLVHGPLVADAQITGLVACRPKTGEYAPLVLYASTDQAGVFRSLDMGKNWEALNGGLPDLQVATLAPSPEEPQFVYAGVGMEVYRLRVSADPTSAVAWERLTPHPLGGWVTHIAIQPGSGGDLYVATGNPPGIHHNRSTGDAWGLLNHRELPTNLPLGPLAVVPRPRQSPLICVATDGGTFCSPDEGQTWIFTQVGCSAKAMVQCLATDDREPSTLYVGTLGSGLYRGRDVEHQRVAWTGYILGFGALVLLGFAFRWVRHYWKGHLVLRQRRLVEQDWGVWNEIIEGAFDQHNRVTVEMLATIPPPARVMAMRRYMDTHKDQDLIFEEESSAIVPANHIALQHLHENWISLLERLDNVNIATPIAARVTEQMCELLGFACVENRTFKALFGYMVKAPAVRLSIPPRFPIVFMLKRALNEQDIHDARDLMSVLNVTSFFALLVVVDDDLEHRDHARELRRLVRGGSDDFIVLDYQDLRSLFLANDAEQRLIELILAQVDLTVVSPYVTSGPVPENMFFGRDYELKAIMRTIRDRSFAIVGGRKIGKTSVLAKVHRLMAQTSDFHSYYLDCQHVSTYEAFFGELAINCQINLGSTAPDVLRRIVLQLRRQHGPGVIVLLLDEVDHLLAFDIRNQTRMFRVFRALSQEGLCRFVFCGERQLHKALHDPDSPLFNFASIMRLSYLAERDARRVIQEPMATMGVTFEDPEALIGAITALSSCHPNLVQAICQMLIKQVNARSDRLVRMTDISDVRTCDDFREFFLEVTWGNATTLERLISVLMVDASSFAVADVRQALMGRGLDLPGATIEEALAGLELLSILQKQGNQYAFAARAFPRLVSASQLSEGFVEGFIEELKARAPQR